MVNIIPRNLPLAPAVATNADMIIDNGTAVYKATVNRVVDAGAPIATLSDVTAGVKTRDRVSSSVLKQAIDLNFTLQGQPFVDLAQAWAESPGNPDPSIPGGKSAKTWAGEAKDAALAIGIGGIVPSADLQRLACELDVGNVINGVNTEAFLNAQRPMQDFTFINSGATVLMSIAAEGSVYNTDERARICVFDFSDGGVKLTQTGFTGLLNIGHVQGFKAIQSGIKTYIYTTSKTLTLANPGKGFSKIEWKGPATVDADVTQYVLFGDEGSGHIYENLYRAMPTVSDDGKWLIIHAELKAKSDDNGMVLFYDLAEVEAAADPKTVIPKSQWRTQNPPWNNAWVKQGISWGNDELKIVYSGSSVEDAKFIEFYSFNGDLKRRDIISGNLDLYGVNGVLSDAAKGPMIQAEIEGLEEIDGRLFFGFATQFVLAPAIVTATIGGKSMNLAARINVPAGIEAWDQAYWTRTKLAATAGAHDKASTYSTSTTKMEKGKFIWEYGSDTGDGRWIGATTGWYGLSANERQSAGNTLDYAVPVGDTLTKGFHSSLGGGDGIQMIATTDVPGESRLHDIRSDSTDPVRYGLWSKVSNLVSKYLYLSSSNGAAITLFDSDSAANPGFAVVKAADGVDTSFFSFTPKGVMAGVVPSAKEVLVNSNSAVSITPKGKTGMIMVWNGQAAGSSAVPGCVYYDISGTPACVKMFGAALLATTTGVLTGTTGTVGNLTVSAHSDGKIYIENRIAGGFNRYIAYQEFCSERT